ncbi:MAG: hypothetical protein ACOX29_07625 [Bacillota bacterium]|jgi:cellulose synthase/poly-beta-1,6-N-acetylglucosamine synthase-like glycosyltransferase|nr:hypothetical protein [Bacillota bacterium]NLU54948.1 hypothetical protein [Bacillota bacterium]HOA90967.1 hypothetical protein [Bacillota bacterium]HOJ46463.1 hypothetical protein [Bacillota bacterium]HOL12874.1 hypothetical protein [Bacillota bacterium]
MKIIDMKKWQRQRRRNARGQRFSRFYSTRVFVNMGSVILIGYVLSFLVPVWLSVIIAMVIYTYGREFWAKFRP